MAEATADPALRRLEELLVAAGAPIAGYLAPGLSAPEVEARLAGAGILGGPDVVTLYGWHDGTNAPAGAGHETWEIAPAVFFQSLDQAIAAHGQMREVAHAVAGAREAEGITPDDLWHPAWLPAFRHLGPYHHAVSSGEGAASGIWFVAWDQDPVREYDDLDGLVERWIARLENGIYHPDSSGRLDMDEPRLVALEGVDHPV